MLTLYSIFLFLFNIGIRIFGLWNTKAKKMLDGRKKQLVLENKNSKIDTIWMHCASLGEYEQGLPLLQQLKLKNETIKIIVSFFSSSGFDAFKQNNIVNEIYYLPFDSKQNAVNFIDKIKPSKVFFVKYELWYFYLKTLSVKGIPTYMISMYIPKNHLFRKWYGKFHRKMLALFTHIFVQDVDSKIYLDNINKNQISAVTVAGDSRYDRVIEMSKQHFSNSIIEQFKQNFPCLIAGSTWPNDEQLLANLIVENDWKLIIAPHEIGQKHISNLQNLFKGNCSLLSNYIVDKKVLIIDEIGILKMIYQYADVVYIGGGFGTGIHNILEPLAFHKPVLHGPNCDRFLESKLFGQIGAVKIINSVADCKIELSTLFSNKKELAINIEQLMKKQSGSVAKIMQKVEAKT